MSSTTVESASFGIQDAQDMVSSEFPVNITRGCGLPLVVYFLSCCFTGGVQLGRVVGLRCVFYVSSQLFVCSREEFRYGSKVSSLWYLSRGRI